jgi:serine/threonine protein kinase
MNLLSSLKLGEKIGEGCFGEVFEATEDVCGKLAVKMICRQSTESDQDWSSRSMALLAEGQRLENANHPNVVKVMQLARATDGQSVNLALEYCEGGSLESAYANGPMRFDRLRSVIVHVCNGLHAIHARGMLHRDLKPSNVLVGKGVYKIGDFGLVANHDVLGYASAQGYASNVAPEVFRDNRTSVASDIWALGMLIYRLLHGENFCSEFENGLGDIVDVVTRGGFSRLLRWLPHVPDKWRRAVRRALRDEPNKRYRDPIQLAQAFQAQHIGIRWDCVWTPERVTWTREKVGRQITVVHESLSERRHRWEAVSTGRQGGRRLTLGKSAGLISASQCARELELFFKRAK